MELKRLKTAMVSLTALVLLTWLILMHRFNYNIAAAVNITFAESHRDALNSDQYPTVLIGIGSMKSGSSYFLDALSLSNYDVNLTFALLSDDQSIFTSASAHTLTELTFIQPRSDSINDAVVRNIGELKYWTWCWASQYPHLFKALRNFKNVRIVEECSWSDYLANWNWTSHHNNLVLVEKSANYLREPHSAMLLGYYSHLLADKVRVYVSLRNPVQRTWSHLFYSCFNRMHSDSDKEQCSASQIAQKLENDMDMMSRNYPDWHRMLGMMRDEHVDDEMVVDLFQKGFYSLKNLIDNDDAIITSCYEPQIRMWNKHLKHGALKIFQFEEMNRNISGVIHRLRTWIRPENTYYAQNPIDRNKLLRSKR